MKIINFDSNNNSVSSSSYISEKMVDSGYVQFGIACGFISTTEILFTVENIIARVTDSGNVEFYDNNKNLLAAICVPADSDGRGHYEDICCKVEDGKIMMRFPMYTWYDNYPDCDGEYDRWDAHIVGYESPIVFDIKTHECVISDR